MYFRISDNLIPIENNNGEKNVYILLIRTNTLFSRFISKITKASYTHASLGVNARGCDFYSFARKYSRLPLPGGFVNENLSSGLMGRHPQTPCALFSVTVSDEVYASLCSRLDRMNSRKKQLKYSLRGTVFCFFHLPASFEDRYFCSQFVADTLQEEGILKLYKPASLYHPMDFFNHGELSLCYEGTIGDLRSHLLSV